MRHGCGERIRHGACGMGSRFASWPKSPLGVYCGLTMEYVPHWRMASVTNDAATRTLRSGELAQLAGVSRDTLRHYERMGLLPKAQRSAKGYRRYAPEALERVRLIRGALAIGFTVQELHEVFEARDRGVAPCER